MICNRYWWVLSRLGLLVTSLKHLWQIFEEKENLPGFGLIICSQGLRVLLLGTSLANNNWL